MALMNGRIPTLLLHRLKRRAPNGKALYVRRGSMVRSLSVLLRLWVLLLGKGELPILDAYRDLAGQRAALAYWTKLGQPWKAATPGSSTHGLALAVDFGGQLQSSVTAGHKLARWLFPLLGWHWEGKQWGEPWHWVFRGWPSRPVLRRGATGNTVRLWQAYLLLAKVTVAGRRLRVDGEFGPTTELFTRAWQRRVKLTPDGIVGPRSWKRARLT